MLHNRMSRRSGGIGGGMAILSPSGGFAAQFAGQIRVKRVEGLSSWGWGSSCQIARPKLQTRHGATEIVKQGAIFRRGCAGQTGEESHMYTRLESQIVEACIAGLVHIRRCGRRCSPRSRCPRAPAGPTAFVLKTTSPASLIAGTFHPGRYPIPFFSRRVASPDHPRRCRRGIFSQAQEWTLRPR